MKKEILSLSFIFVLLLTLFALTNNIQSTRAEDALSPSAQLGISSDLENQLSPDKIDETTSKATQRWEYLKKEWKTVLLKNKIVSAIDSALTKINIVFKVLFNKDYELLSASFWIIILLWLFFFYIFGTIIKDFSTFSSGISFIISALLTIVCAQVNLLSMQANFLIWLASAAFGNSQPWWASMLVWTGIFIVLVIVMTVVNKFGGQMKANREKTKLLEERLKIKTGAISGEALTKAMSK